MARCGSCGSAQKIEIAPRASTGIRTTKQSRLPLNKPILKDIAKPAAAMVTKKLAEKANSTSCPLCGSMLRATIQQRNNKQTTFLECVNGGCDYKRKA